MLLLAIKGYINLGEILWYLRYAKENWEVHGERNVLNYIGTIFSYLDEFNLPVTRRAGEYLKGFQVKLKKRKQIVNLQVMRQMNLRV